MNDTFLACNCRASYSLSGSSCTCGSDARAATHVRCASPATQSTASTYLGANRKRPAPEDTSPSRLCVYPFSTSTACDNGSGQYEAPAMRRMVTCSLSLSLSLSLCAPRHARSESMVTALRKHPTATTCRRMPWPCYNHPTATRNMDSLCGAVCGCRAVPRSDDVPMRVQEEK